MDLLVYLIIFAAVIFLLLLLPLVSGVGSYKLENTHRNSPQISNNDNQEYAGYVSPEEAKRREEEEKKKNSKLNRIKNIKLSKDDIPLKFKTSLGEGTNHSVRNRKSKKVIDPNPSNFDFDLDELIQEEKDDDLREEQLEFEQRKAKSQQDLEELV